MDLSKQESHIPGYKTVSMRDIVYQPGASTPNNTMKNDMVCHITEGELTVTYAETGETCTCGPGTKITGVPNVVHREKTEGYKALIGIPVPPAELTQPINKPLPAPAG